MLRQKPSTKTCHFCNTSVSGLHGDFKCPSCETWNMFDRNGRLVSDHPAMHDEALNAGSFAKRASPNKNRLPSSFSTNVFCHTCQTNQTLTMNLLSNYLPASSDPSYAQRLAEYPAYKESLYARYPPVCANCQPAVDEQIREKDSMAKSAALGGWLQASARRGKSPGAGFGEKSPGAGIGQVAIWNIRGALWLAMTTWWLFIDIQGGLTYPLTPKFLPYPNLPIGAVSIMWQFWDPTWKSLQQTRLQGHEARVEGKTSWLRSQGIIWVVRALLILALRFQPSFLSRAFFWGALSIELLINLFAFRSIRIIRPPRIRLVASSRTSHRVQEHSPGANNTLETPSPQPPTDVPTFSGLSLSTLSPPRPTRAVNPIFGVASLPQSQSQFQSLSGGYDSVDPSDAMDWTPAVSYTKDEAAELLRPARFAPEKPTGLEGLIEKFGIGGEEADQPVTNQQSSTDSAFGIEKGVVIGVFAGLALVGVVAFVVTWWPQWLASQQSDTQVLTPQHIIDDL
ncbi:Ima1 N-terminal domain-containing protein [Rhizoctonia solani]|nr:Ima1 N-terminal domain-containing protein [Rhizoctonia solani]